MDHRCLYGHRISEQFNFAILQRMCPICGAPSVTLDGYKLARELAQEVPMDALAAFNAACYLESHYTLVALDKNAHSYADDAGAADGASAPYDGPSGATELLDPESLSRDVPRRGVPAALSDPDAPAPARRDTDMAERDFFKK